MAHDTANAQAEAACKTAKDRKGSKTSKKKTLAEAAKQNARKTIAFIPVDEIRKEFQAGAGWTRFTSTT